MVRLPSGALKCRSNCKVDVDVFDKSRFHPQQRASLDEHYVVETTVLGTGGFGTVRKAAMRSGGPACVVKSIAKTGRVAVASADNEVQILQGLAHLNICKLLDVCEDHRNIHLVLEYVNGHELFEEISLQTPMTEYRAACIMRQVFIALQYCHELERSIIHRDVKPENIMLTKEKGDPTRLQVKLIDWGLAAVCYDTIQTPIVGTPCYMSPEALSKGIYSRASDMWSTGVVLYQLLTGSEAPNHFKPLTASDSPQAKLLDELGSSQSACDLLHSLLQEQPSERLAASLAVRHHWTSATSNSQESEEQFVFYREDSVDVQPLGEDTLKDGRDDARRTATLDKQMHSRAAVTSHIDDDFAVFDDLVVFDDFKEVGYPPSPKVKQHRHQCGKMPTGFQAVAPLGESTTVLKPRNSLHKPSNAIAKENFGPSAPLVCKHGAAPASQYKRVNAGSKEVPARPRLIR